MNRIARARQWLARWTCDARDAVFLDVPSVVDSAWRHFELRGNAEVCYDLTTGNVGVRPLLRRPSTWLFVLLIFFTSYGPTWYGFCNVAPWFAYGQPIVGYALMAVSLVCVFVIYRALARYAERREERVVQGMNANRGVADAQPAAAVNPASGSPPAWQFPRRRSRMMYATIAAAVVLGGIAVFALGFLAVYPDPDMRSCAGTAPSLLSQARFGLCVGAAVVYFVAFRRNPSEIMWQILIQEGILVAILVMQCLYLTTSESREADYLPYRHVFLVFAPLVLSVPCCALLIACLLFGHAQPDVALEGKGSVPARPTTADATAHAARVGNAELSELFVNRVDPEVSGLKLINAVMRIFTRPLHFLLFPSIVAMLAPSTPIEPQQLPIHFDGLVYQLRLAGWLASLYPATCLALATSLLVSVWGTLSVRWRQLLDDMQRLFFRGTPFAVSYFIIVVAVARLLQVSYVTTIIDPAPFGVILFVIVMTYVLFWLVEYWLNRIAGYYLLRTLGKVVEKTYICYDVPQRGPDILVEPDGRVLAVHGTGRFVTLGRRLGSAGQAAKPPPDSSAACQPGCDAARALNRSDLRFQTYSYFALLERLDPGNGDGKTTALLEDRTNAYFACTNLLVILILATFVISVVVTAKDSDLKANPLVSASVVPAQTGVDLAGLLSAQSAAHRPALVIVGSGGGTRAALYTTAVLRGLHQLGVDKDIVLASGVSGGGVALAYFAAYRARLADPQMQAVPVPNCEQSVSRDTANEVAWDCFGRNITQPFIEDVLEGATEWRVFRNDSFSTLLAESFSRRLFGNRLLADVAAPALILNSTIAGHPQEDSELLMRTVQRPSGASREDCRALEQPFSEMSGGRLVFTNLRADSGFPSSAKVRGFSVPDVRLPYVVVNDPTVPLAAASALNANFPPVFANARVRLRDDKLACPYRSFYVTDGGAEENLGLISALYVLRDAVTRLQGVDVPDIHIVIAEASAVTYDYTQDRGLDAIVGTSRERLSGGLTEELIAQLQAALGPHTLAIHDLPLPLAFRARGGVGTHWMYAKRYHLSDPRDRDAPGLFTTTHAMLDRKSLEALWSALHDPSSRFCDYSFQGDSATVQQWVCKAKDGVGDLKDIHTEQWDMLVRQLKIAK